MQRARPAPLLLVALALGAGCFLGLQSAIDSTQWLAAVASLFVFWVVAIWVQHRFFPQRAAFASYLVLLLFTVAVGGFHGSLREAIVRADDVRVLSEEKADPRCQWRGTVTADPRFRPRSDSADTGRTTLVVALDSWRPAREVEASALWQPASGNLQVSVDQTGPDSYRYGDVVEVTGGLDPLPDLLNPGQFDIATYLRQQDIFFRLSAKPGAVSIHSRDTGSWVTRLAGRTRDWSLAQLRLGIENDPAISGLLAGMLIGYVEGVPLEIESAFRNTGTYHIFAVSGQNVAVICGVGLVVLQLLGLVRWRWGWMLLPLLVFYCLVTGGQPSAVRALLMAGLVLAAWWLERPVSVLNLWAMALIAVLVYDARLALSLSAQLSFAVVLALIVLTPPFYNLLLAMAGLSEEEETAKGDDRVKRPLRGPWAQWVWKSSRGILLLIASSCAAWLGSLPLMAWYFHQFTWIGLVANLLVVPLAGVIVVVGAMAVAVAPVSAALTAVLNNANWLLAKILVGLVTFFAQVPGGCFYVPDWSVTWRPAEPEFVCLAVGGTTPMLVRYQGRTWLVNTGTESQFRYTTNPVRKFYGVNRIEEAVLTELGSLQAGGARLLLAEEIVGAWATPPRQKITKGMQPWLETLAAQKEEPQIWSTGREQVLAPGFTVTVLSPGEENGARRMEDRGLVLLFRWAPAPGVDRSLLYAGRIGRGVEESILAQGLSVRADVLIQGVHGKEPNLELDWLRAVRPLEVITPVKTEFTPEQMDSVELLDEHERPHVWRQGDCGAVTVRLTRKGYEVTPFRDVKK